MRVRSKKKFLDCINCGELNNQINWLIKYVASIQLQIANREILLDGKFSTSFQLSFIISVDELSICRKRDKSLMNRYGATFLCRAHPPSFFIRPAMLNFLCQSSTWTLRVTTALWDHKRCSSHFGDQLSIKTDWLLQPNEIGSSECQHINRLENKTHANRRAAEEFIEKSGWVERSLLIISFSHRE